MAKQEPVDTEALARVLAGAKMGLETALKEVEQAHPDLRAERILREGASDGGNVGCNSGCGHDLSAVGEAERDPKAVRVGDIAAIMKEHNIGVEKLLPGSAVAGGNVGCDSGC